MKKGFFSLWTARLLVGSLGMVLSAGCGEATQLDVASTVNNTNTGLGDTVTPTLPTDNSEVMKKVNFEGAASGGAYDGVLVAKLDKVNEALVLVLPLPSLGFDFPQLDIPQLQGTELTNILNSDGTQSVAVSIPLKYILKGGVLLPNVKLPNGDNLPFVPAGELPGVGIALRNNSNHKIYLYVGVAVAAVFVETSFDLPIGFMNTVKNKEKTRTVGALGYVLPKRGFDGGMYLASQLPDDVARFLDQHLRLD